MTDNVNVVLSVTEKGLESVQRDVEALRSELQELGIDMSNIERRLGGIEKSATSTSRAVKSFATASRESSRAVDEEAKASARAERATQQRTKAERDLERARKQQTRSEEFADFDKQFEDLNRLTGAQQNFIAGRYALYDVAASYAAVGTALAGASIYAVTVGAQFESAFTNVARTLDTDTTPQQIDAIRSSLVQLSGQIPLTFAEISQIATLGNQLGLGADEVTSFTNTVARFASVSGLSIDAVSNSFGGFLAQTGLGAEYLENLGSAVALVGINSNATEAQIVSLMREIAAGAAGAGFTADQIVGLAGALASFQVAPERARGVLDTYFGTLNRAVAEGGDRLQTFANVAGYTTEELSKLVRTGEGARIFQDLLSGIQELNPDAAELTVILDQLGLTGLRASNTFQRFLGNLKISGQAFEDAYNGFREGSELNRQYSQTLDDLSSQFTIFVNGLNAVVAAISGGAVESFAGLFMAINNVVFAVADFINQNRLAATIGAIAISTAAIIGGFILFRSVLILATAAIYAARGAIQSVGAQALASAGTIRGLAGAFVGLQGASTGAAGGVLTLRAAIRALLASTGIGLLVTLGGELIGNLLGAGGAASDASLSLNEYKRANAEAAAASRGASGGSEDLADVLAGSGGGADKSVADSADQAAESIRTLVDYVSDLTGVFRRSSDIRFGADDAFDDITLAWIKLREESEKYQAQIRSLTADRKLKEYFLSIAELYNDQIRAGELREDIAAIDDKLAEAQAGASTELEGNSKAAIENRKVFRDLLGSYEDYVAALASAGASQEQIQAVISQLNADFGDQATALGFNAGEVANYQARFQDLSTIISQIPPVNVQFNGGPAEIALAEFFAKAEEQARLAGQGASDAFNEGLGGLGDIPIDESYYKELGKTQGRQVAKNWWEEFLNFLEMVFVDFPTTVGDYIGSAIENAVTEGNRLAAALWSGFTEWLGTVFAGFPDFIRDLVIPAETQARFGGSSIGNAISGGVNAALGNTLNIGGVVNNAILAQDGALRNSGAYAGSRIASGISDALSNAFKSTNVGKIVTADYGFGSHSSGGFVDGFSSGGYTGAGHWLMPAGLVHKGEYVVPKRHVDQATGLPSVDYVASLQRGKSAPKGGYATGGHVGGGFGGPFELGPASLGFLASALRVDLSVGQERLARSVSAGDSKLAWQGSN